MTENSVMHCARCERDEEVLTQYIQKPVSLFGVKVVVPVWVTQCRSCGTEHPDPERDASCLSEAHERYRALTGESVEETRNRLQFMRRRNAYEDALSRHIATLETLISDMSDSQYNQLQYDLTDWKTSIDFGTTGYEEKP